MEDDARPSRKCCWGGVSSLIELAIQLLELPDSPSVHLSPT